MALIRHATVDDIEACAVVLEHAKAYLRDQGLTQWQGEYPGRHNIETDIHHGELFVAVHEETGEIMGTAMITLRGEPNYEDPLRGTWLTQSPDDMDTTYACIHRVTCAPEFRGQGVATALMRECELLAHDAGKRSCRVETHPNNVGMRRVAEKLGYVHCCDISSIHDEQHGRVAYEKLLWADDVPDNGAGAIDDDIDDMQRHLALWWAKHRTQLVMSDGE